MLTCGLFDGRKKVIQILEQNSFILGKVNVFVLLEFLDNK